jgi:DNA polymerase-3 subunit alpha
MAPTSFEDVSAVIALYRPGPMGVRMHYDYADRKNKRKPVEYFHPEAEEVLGDTFGLMIYQESVMRVAQRFAGYSLAEADNLRKACGKKVRELMEKERSKFVEGCEKTGYGHDLGTYLFGIIENFADYAFNKSHSFGYGLVCYQTAYLKAVYPVQFFAALLTSVKDNIEKATGYLSDARRQKINVLLPDINESAVDFSARPDDRTVLFALSAIKGVGSAVCAKIVAEREANGRFESFHDFCMRVPVDCLNKRTVEGFIRAGAFDSMGHSRRGLLAVFESIIDDAVSRRHEAEQGVLSLFDSIDTSPGEFSVDIAIPELELDRESKIKFEKELLGLYISDHPLWGHEGTLARRATATTADVADLQGGSIVTLGGVVTKLERKTTRRGDQMILVTLEDFHGVVELTVYSKVAASHGAKLREDGVVLIKARVNQNDERISLSVADIEPLRLSTTITDLRLNMPSDTIGKNRIDELREILRRHPGESRVYLHLGQGKVLQLGSEFAVQIDRVVPELRVAFGIDVVLPAN